MAGALMWLLKLTRGFHYSALSILLSDYSNHQLQNSLSFRFCKIIHSLPTSSYTAVNSLSKHSPKISRTGFSVSCFSWTLLLQERTQLLLSTREICIRTKHLIRLYRQILRFEETVVDY
ncbi:hypothetical protein VNO80_25785 [Phaseolus coccineus]|uniref:Uncharacterized protein n=1 Tax=Phaseolus coccineus TaxID=3886 RepID=A0AAN9QP13_PHACN